MAKYRKKPVVIDAVQWNGENNLEVAAFMDVITMESTSEYVFIPTLEGTMKANVGDWIIKGVKGEFYPCKPDIFEATYETAKEEINQEQWDEAIKDARFMLEEYKSIPAGVFGAITITQTISRYDNGERTQELYEELLSIQ